MKARIGIVSSAVAALALAGCAPQPSIRKLMSIAPGWSGELIPEVDESYAGWDVEIGDADNDGLNEVATVTCPRGRMYVFERTARGWITKSMFSNLAQDYPGMGLVAKVVDLNQDGVNEIVAGTGQENGGTSILYAMEPRGDTLVARTTCRPEVNRSSCTHGIACFDLDHDGVLEAISAYCGGGEIVRYDFDRYLTTATARLIHPLSGSGEEFVIADVDNDGSAEYLTSNGFRAGEAKVEIYEFDDRGELVIPPRLVLDGFDGQSCFYASLTVGDLENDGLNELVVEWKPEQRVNRATILAYRVGTEAQVAYPLAYQDTAFDLAYFEKMMEIADADNDGRNELVVSTRGEEQSEHIESRHLGHVFLLEIVDGEPVRTLLADLHEGKAESSRLAVGDADNDGKNEIVLATGKGDRRKPGTSYVLLLRKAEGSTR